MKVAAQAVLIGNQYFLYVKSFQSTWVNLTPSKDISIEGQITHLDKKLLIYSSPLGGGSDPHNPSSPEYSSEIVLQCHS